MKDGAFDGLLQMLHTTLLPAGNSLPRSHHMFRKVVDMKRPGDCKYHTCPSGKHYFGPLPRNKWSVEEGGSCPCGMDRFREVSIVGGRTRVEPAGTVSSSSAARLMTW